MGYRCADQLSSMGNHGLHTLHRRLLHIVSNATIYFSHLDLWLIVDFFIRKVIKMPNKIRVKRVSGWVRLADWRTSHKMCTEH